MAKAKTTRKSSGSTSKKGTGKGGKKSSKSPKAQKKMLVCEFCDKPMKDEKTKKLHERNCLKKVEVKKPGKKEGDLDSTILKIKDEFEDQRKQMESEFKDREERLHRELGEIKEVLRLEMERRHTAHKVQDVTPKKEEAAEPEPQEKPVPETPKPVAPPTEDARAIDKIPTPLPNIPERKVPEDYDRPRVEVIEIGRFEPPSDYPQVVQTDGPDKDEILDMIKAEMEAAVQKFQDNRPEPVVVNQDVEPLNEEIRKLRSEVAGLKMAVQESQTHAVKREEMAHVNEFKRIERELAKFTDKIAEIMDEIGFGESLSVSKIPPTILEIVYQATLDDLMKELIKTVGSQDAEKISRLALEEVRLKTSGSELFKFDGRKIVTDNLAKSIEKDLISATQIQTTYDELLDRFLEHLPHHKAKNFRAMIKVKSQEFAVDRATILTKKIEKMDKHLDSTSQMLAALSAQIGAKHLKIDEELKEIKETLLAGKAEVSELETLRAKLKEREEKEAALTKDIGLLRAEMEMNKKLATKKAEKVEEKKEEEKKAKEEPKPDKKPDHTGTVLKAIQTGASSKTAINRETGLEENDILDAVATLVKDKKVVEKKVGKRLKYQTPDQTLEEELGKKEKKAPAKKEKAKPEKDEVAKPEKEEPKKEEDKAEPKKKEAKKPAPKKKEKDVTEPPKEVKKKPAKKGKGKEKPEVKKEPKKPSKPEKEEKVEEPEKEEPPVKEEKIEAPDEEKKEKVQPPKKEEAEPPKKEKKTEEKEEVRPEDVEVEDEPPPVTKSLNDLNEEEKKVLDVITEDGLTMSGIRSKVEKDMKYMSVLRSLRVLIDSGLVNGVTKGRLTLYQKIIVEKMDEKEKSDKDKEVK